MNKCFNSVFFPLLAAVFGLSVSEARAEEPPNASRSVAAELGGKDMGVPAARFRLERGARFAAANRESGRRGEEAELSWEALTRYGPASGNDPAVGPGSGKPYYDFTDGQPHPYYIQPE